MGIHSTHTLQPDSFRSNLNINLERILAMSKELQSLLNRLYKEYVTTGSEHNFADWVQIKRTGSVHFDPRIQGCSGLELDNLLYIHHLRKQRSLLLV